MNGNGECSNIAVGLGGFEAQADWLGPKVAAVQRPCYIYLRQGGNVFAGFCLSVCLFVCVLAR